MPRQAYKTKDGEHVPGASTVAKIIGESGGLLYWANKQGRLGKTLEDARKTEADAGTLAHSMVEAHLHGEDPEKCLEGQYVETVAGARTAFGAFLDWRSVEHFEPIIVEASFVSETHRYGGTLDAIGKSGSEGLTTLCDWKTGKAYPEHILQLAGYRHLYEEATGDTIERVMICIFSKDSGLMAPITVPMPVVEDAWGAFLQCRALYDMRAKLKKVLP